MGAKKYIQANKFQWEQKAIINFASRYYNVNSFRQGKSTLRPIELSALRNVRGKSLLHLQCHFGLDTLSWARRGANVVGVDFSEKAIQSACSLAEDCRLPARFIQSDIYDLRRHLHGKFDIVFVSYGSIGWLPDLKRWAETVAHFLKRGGVFYIVDFHPVYWMLDQKKGKIIFPYESGTNPLVFQATPYADAKARIKARK